MPRQLAVLCAVGAVLALATAAGAQDKVLLHAVAAPGDVWTSDQQQDISSNVSVSAGGRSTSVQTSHQDREQYTARVLAVDAAQQPAAVRFAFRASHSTDTGPDGTAVKTVRFYQGRVVTVRKSGGKTSVSVDKGKLTAGDRTRLARYLEATDNDLLPDKPVAIGDEWPIDQGALRHMFGPAGQVAGTGKLDSIGEHRGFRCACIKFLFQVTGMPSGPVKVDASFSGYGYFALDLKRTLDMALGGPVTARGTIRAGGTEVPIEGTGDTSLKEDVRWIKIAGRPVPQPGAH